MNLAEFRTMTRKNKDCVMVLIPSRHRINRPDYWKGYFPMTYSDSNYDKNKLSKRR
jgi:hypothetical protein